MYFIDKHILKIYLYNTKQTKCPRAKFGLPCVFINSFTETKSCSFVYVLFMAASLLRWQN